MNDHRSSNALDTHRLQPLLAPRSVAIVGASNREGSAGLQATQTFLRRRSRGRAYAINPRYPEVQGLACFASLAALPEVPDLAILVVANARLEEELEACAAAGVRAAVIFGSTYLAEDDPERPLVARLGEIARRAGMQVCGSNCYGFHNVREAVHVSLSPPHERLRDAPAVFISHSGTAFGEMVDLDGWIGLALAVSAGQEIATTAADYLDYALSMASIRCVALLLEAVRDPARFVAGLQRARRQGVPIVILKVGRTREAARLAISHSGAIVGDDDAYRALFARHGVVQVSTLGEMVNAIQLLAYGKPLSPGGLAAILDSGGKRGLLLDLAADVGLPMARIGEATKDILAAHLDPGLPPVNPLDYWGSGYDWDNRFQTNMAALADDPDTAICVLAGILGFSGVDSYTDKILGTAGRTEQPLGVVTDFLRRADYPGMARLNEACIPVLLGEHSALRALKAVMGYRDFLARPALTPPAPPAGAKERWEHRLARGGALDDLEASGLLADYGLPTLPTRVVDDLEGARDAAEALGYPVVLKTATGVAHKTEVGGVKLRLADPAALELAYADLRARLGPRVLVALTSRRRGWRSRSGRCSTRSRGRW